MSRPIKIFFIIDVLDTDLAGTENQLIKLINGLDKTKFNVQLICLKSHPWFQANRNILDCFSTIIEINRFNKIDTYLNFFKLINAFKSNNPDIVHTFFPTGNIVGVIAAKLAGVKLIISSRRDFGEWINGRYLFATKLANKFVDAVITNSYQVKELTERKERLKNGKVFVISNGIDTASFRAFDRSCSLKKKLNIPDHHKVVGIVANFRPMKHHYTFLKAAREILKTRDDVSFILVGKGSLQADLERTVNLYGINDHMHFTGPQKEVIPYLSIMDVGINCSEKEGLSNAIMEYMASGVPCVVSDAGGNSDLISHNINGYTFKLDDYKALADLTLDLIKDKETRDKFIFNAREKIEKEMSLEVMLSKYETIYQKLLNGRN